jgi:alkylhydroperoxidase/carboxymuconolactone decarboxylase family protein YurZ
MVDPAAEAAGREVRARLFGGQTPRPRPSDTIAPDLGVLSDTANWGSIWARPGLDLRTRSICVIVALVAQGKFEYARLHVSGAKNIGIPESELIEVAMQLLFYTSLPTVHETLKLIQDVYRDA